MLKINGELADPDLIEETFSRIKSEAESRLQVSCCERDDEFLALAREEVTDAILISQEAEARFPTLIETEVRARLEQTFKTFRQHGASWEMLEQQRENLRSETEAALRMEKLIAETAGPETEPTAAEFQSFYEENEADYRLPQKSRALHLVKLLASSENPGSLYLQMVALRQEALAGLDFEILAARETEKQTGQTDLGWISLDQPTNPFESILFSLNQDEVSPVFAYENAFHLIKITDHHPAQTTPLEEVRQEIKTRLQAGKKRAALQNLAQTLRQTAEIEMEME